MTILDEIQKELYSRQDLKYRELQMRTIPSVAPETLIGVRTPELRACAKVLAKREDVQDFLDALPHKFFEENQLHAYILSGMRDFDACIAEV